MKLYTADRAPNPERVKFFLAEKGNPPEVERVEISIMEGKHKTPEYRAKSPFAQLPALELDDGTVLTESRAICSYLEHVYPEPNLMGAAGAEMARIEMWDRRMEFLVLMPAAMWVRHGHPAVSLLEGPNASPEWSETNARRAKKMFAWLDQHLADNAFVAGDRFSIADITAYVACGFVRLMQFKPFDAHANLARWAETLAARPMGQT